MSCKSACRRIAAQSVERPFCEFGENYALLGFASSKRLPILYRRDFFRRPFEAIQFESGQRLTALRLWKSQCCQSRYKDTPGFNKDAGGLRPAWPVHQV